MGDADEAERHQATGCRRRNVGSHGPPPDLHRRRQHRHGGCGLQESRATAPDPMGATTDLAAVVALPEER